MGYQEKQRPDYFDMREGLRLSGIDRPDEEIRKDYKLYLLADIQADLTDLIMEIEDSFNSMTQKNCCSPFNLSRIHFVNITRKLIQKRMMTNEY